MEEEKLIRRGDRRMKIRSKLLFLGVIAISIFLVLSGCSGDSESSEAAKEDPESAEEDVTDNTGATEGLPKEIKDRGKFVVGVKVDYPPIGFLDENGENVGFEIDLVERIAESAFGSKDAVEFVPVTASNRIPYLTSNKIDFIAATIGITEERKQEVDFSIPTFTSGVMTLVPKDSEIQDVADLDGEKVITIKGTTGSIYLEEEYPGAKQIKMDTTSDAVRALKDNRGVAFLGDAVLQFDVAKENPDLKLVGEQVAMSSMAMAFRKGDDELLQYINERLEELREEDYYMALINKWLPSTEELFDDVGEMIPRP